MRDSKATVVDPPITDITAKRALTGLLEHVASAILRHQKHPNDSRFITRDTLLVHPEQNVYKSRGGVSACMFAIERNNACVSYSTLQRSDRGYSVVVYVVSLKSPKPWTGNGCERMDSRETFLLKTHALLKRFASLDIPPTGREAWDDLTTQATAYHRALVSFVSQMKERHSVEYDHREWNTLLQAANALLEQNQKLINMHLQTYNGWVYQAIQYLRHNHYQVNRIGT